MKKPKIGTPCEIEFEGKWWPGKIVGYQHDLRFKQRVNVETEGGRLWQGCSPQCVRVNGKELEPGPF